MRDDAYIENLFRKIAVHDSREAFKELFFEFYPALCIFAQRYVNDPETSEDIVQETFLKVWKNRKTIDIRLSFRNFLLTSVKNRLQPNIPPIKLSCPLSPCHRKTSIR